MKKWYYVVIAVILVAGISIWGYFKYQQKQSYQAGIYQKTNMLVKIDTYKVLKELVTTDQKGADSIGIIRDIIKTVEIPANIFIYTVEGKQETTFFGSTKITDYSSFEKYTEHGFERKEIDSRIKLLVSKNHKWTIVYDKTTAVFAYSRTGEEVLDIMQEIIRKKNMEPVENSRFKEITDKKGQIVFYDGIDEGSLNLDDTKITGEFQFNSKEIKVPAETESPVFSKDNIVSVWLQADIKSMLPHKTYTIDAYQINSDSLLSFFQNEVQLEITEPVIQKESEITYDFDDNFEKVEVVKVKETVIPGLSLQVKSQADKMYGYLHKQKIITDSSMVNRKVFPLYQLYTEKTAEGIVFSTRKKPIFAPRIKSDLVFYLKIDFEKMGKEKEFSSVYKYIQNFQILEIKTRTSQDKIFCEWEFEFKKDSPENPLFSLWRLMNIVK